ncbi:MAG: DUF1801 domain-containing protein [Planktotalea sp.]|uniref:DUF1801 domain-containing protein n=1 Tax=Planktotalea sp. TaxID=2029877 RepID=UPI003C768BB9
MDQSTAQNIISVLKTIINNMAPDIRFVPKYGGEVMCPDPESDKKFVGGIFQYKDHVSLEFSDGVALGDPNNHLEGSGKKRRHLKFERLEDVAKKDTDALLAQCLS